MTDIPEDDDFEAETAAEAQPDDAAKFRAGEAKVLNFLMGQVMKRTGGKADPKAVRELLARMLKA
mgnify:CR=1 FL=1